MRATRTFEPDPAHILEARRFAAALLAEWGLSAEELPLLVSELATNAVLHARSEFAVTIIGGPERIRVEVADGNSRLPSMAAVSPDAYSGRGLMLVQALAHTWGVDSHTEHGKVVWCEIIVAEKH